MLKYKNITKWLYKNKLHLNAAKSKMMIFNRHQNKIPEISIKMNNNPIERVEKNNFLSITR